MANDKLSAALARKQPKTDPSMTAPLNEPIEMLTLSTDPENAQSVNRAIAQSPEKPKRKRGDDYEREKIGYNIRTDLLQDYRRASVETRRNVQNLIEEAMERYLPELQREIKGE